MAAIDIGNTASDRAEYETIDNYTYVDRVNPADGTGTITTIEIWAKTSLANCEVATFYVVSGNTLSTRDTHTIGAVTSGSKQTFSGLSIAVQTGDYLGITWTLGAIEKDSGTTNWYKSGDNIPCTDVTFILAASPNGATMSLHGTGATTAEEDNAIFFGMNF